MSQNDLVLSHSATDRPVNAPYLEFIHRDARNDGFLSLIVRFVILEAHLGASRAWMGEKNGVVDRVVVDGPPEEGGRRGGKWVKVMVNDHAFLVVVDSFRVNGDLMFLDTNL